MDAVIEAINDTISFEHRNGRLFAGAIVVLHPFSKRMSFNSLLQIPVSEGGFVHKKFLTKRSEKHGSIKYLLGLKLNSR